MMFSSKESKRISVKQTFLETDLITTFQSHLFLYERLQTVPSNWESGMCHCSKQVQPQPLWSCRQAMEHPWARPGYLAHAEHIQGEPSDFWTGS